MTTTSISVIAAASTDASDPHEQAVSNAEMAIRDHADHQRYFDSIGAYEPDDEPAVVELRSELGIERLEARLHETVQRRTNSIKDILQAVIEQDGIIGAAQSYDVSQEGLSLGRPAHPNAASLFDGTSYSAGIPVLTEERKEAILRHSSGEAVFLVELSLKY